MKSAIAAAALLLLVGSAFAAETDPLDFDYQVGGRAIDRPAMIFNDGTSTYIQPRAGQAIDLDGSQPSGPYVVLDGVPEVIRYMVNGQPVVAKWKRANGFTSEPANVAGDLPKGFAGFSGRVALVGQHGKLDLVRPTAATMPLSMMVKSLAPAGWTGSAQKDIALSTELGFRTRAGENWVQALERLLDQRNLYAELDFQRQHIALRGTAPKSVGVAGGQFAQETPAAQQAPALRLETSTRATADQALASEGTPRQSDSPLASAMDAEAIRDMAGRTEIRFGTKPFDLVVRGEGGKKLSTEWNEGEKVLSFDSVDQFTVTGNGKAVEVARVPGIAYVFPENNAVGLTRVFEKDNATYLAFKESRIHVSVFGDDNRASGELKDKYYRHNGIASHLTIVADGQTLKIDRRPEVRFYERAGTR